MRKFRFMICMVMAMALALGMMTGCAALTDAGKLEAYDMSGDSIPSINSIVGERKVEGISTGTNNGVAYKEYKYASDTVSADLVAYLNVLMDDYGYLGLIDFNVTEIPGTGRLAGESKDSGKIIVIELDYTNSGYTIRISKGDGTLTPR